MMIDGYVVGGLFISPTDLRSSRALGECSMVYVQSAAVSVALQSSVGVCNK
jgi:hypothetical protein